ncbi:ATP-binding protein [Paenibacillus rhizovicinus]|uniref:ATP-binding protein n=1 Tax=Paenibacillus rhizovicinus TaxID=2704463 RepID=UPI001CDB83E7|nr:ATP-binding protein [Paenibacillus rhizovicinus]
MLQTNQIESLKETIVRWVDNRVPGGIVYGRPRLGKTRAIKYLMHVLPAEFDQRIPVYSLKCRQYKVINENVFFEDILKDINHAYPSSGKASQKRERLTKYLKENVESSGQHRLVFFLDDAQRLADIQYGWLMDINNELDSLGISLTVILVGQKELIHQRSAFQQAKKFQLIGRFMIDDYRFSGVKNVDDAQTCLAGYDQYSDYPEGSGWSFTRYFLPDAFARGFRLEDCAADLFDCFCSARTEAGLFQKAEIPMQYFTLTVDYVLRRYGRNGEDLNQINRLQWNNAIKNSGYIKAEVNQGVEE